MEADVKARASHLPDVSVEQMFLSGESYPGGRSRYFTVRTTERQPELVRAALPLVGPRGVLFASTNAAGWPPEKFLATVEAAIRAGRRKILQRHYAPQPPDFPISRTEPAYLKTVWLRIE